MSSLIKKGAPVLGQNLAGELMRSLLNYAIESAFLDSKHNCFDEMSAGADQKSMKEPEVLPMAINLYLIFRPEMAQLLKMAPPFTSGQS